MSTRRVRIVQCIDSFGAGGTELNLVRTVERLDAREFDLYFLVLNDKGALRERFSRTGIPIRAFSFPRLHSFAALWQALAIIRWLRRLKPDVVHSHDRYTNLFITPCARLAEVPLIITSRRWWTAMPKWIYGIGNRVAYRLSHKVIANNPTVARLMARSEGVPTGRIVVLPNFVDDDAFVSIPDDSRLLRRRCFGIPDNAFVITTVAIFRPEKDLETLIATMAILRGHYPDVHLLLVGSGPCEAALRRAVETHGVNDHVHFPGFLIGPPSAHLYGDLAVLCSLHEGFPNSIVEAMAARKAVVATNVGGIPDAIDDGLTGLLVPPGCPEALAAAIGRLIADAGLRETMAAAGLAKASAAYTAPAVLEKLASLYRGSAQPKSPSGKS